MPFCPKCQFEYLPRIRQCPDCNSPLVDALPEQQDREEAGYEQVVLCVVEGEIPARLLQEALAAANIPCRFQEGGDSFMHSIYGRNPGFNNRGMQIWVNRRDLARAQEIYRDMEGGP